MADHGERTEHGAQGLTVVSAEQAWAEGYVVGFENGCGFTVPVDEAPDYNPYRGTERQERIDRANAKLAEFVDACHEFPWLFGYLEATNPTLMARLRKAFNA